MAARGNAWRRTFKALKANDNAVVSRFSKMKGLPFPAGLSGGREV
jgi:hypothetical protein